MAEEGNTVLATPQFIFPSCGEGYDPASVDVFAAEMHRNLLAAEDEILRLQEEVDEVRRGRLEIGSFEEAEAAIGRAMLVAERHADQVRRQVEAETKQINDTGRAEAEALRISARAEADATLERALEEAERLEAEAGARREEAAREMEAQAATAAAACEQLMAEAQSEAETVRAGARAEADAILQDARDRVDEVRQAAEAAMQRRIAELTDEVSRTEVQLESLKGRRENFEREWNNRVRGLVAFLEAEEPGTARAGGGNNPFLVDSGAGTAA